MIDEERIVINPMTTNRTARLSRPRVTGRNLFLFFMEFPPCVFEVW
jgi:hypothetical protein